MIALALCAVLALVPVGAAAQTLSAEVHPGLLFSAEDIPLLKERIQREPYATWWQTVLQRARNAPATFVDERAEVRYAKSLAFAWLMTDNAAFAERALEVMQGVAFPPRGGDLGEPHNEGEVVAQYAVAYDILHVYAAANDPQALQEMRSILGEEADRLWKGIVIGKVGLGPFKVKIRLHETPHLDNWHIRAYGGLGLAAMALSEYTSGEGTPLEWADRALEMVTSSLDFQIEGRDGGYAEGPFYSRYAADVYLPYLFALKNRTGLDLFADPKIEKMHEWSLNLRLPNGRRPNIDDGHLDDFYGHYLAAVQASGGIHRWDWENNERGLYVRQFSEMDAIALYDDSVLAQEPMHGPSVFMPGAGDAVFRSDWSAAATYMLLRGENGTAREHGFAHEHPDGTSFVLYASGEMLAVDAGYINFDNHDKVNKGRNHNVVLVDGNGPPRRILPVVGTIGDRNDAFIEAFFTSAAGDYVEVRAAYRGVELRRRVFFCRPQVLLRGRRNRRPGAVATTTSGGCTAMAAAPVGARMPARGTWRVGRGKKPSCWRFCPINPVGLRWRARRSTPLTIARSRPTRCCGCSKRASMGGIWRCCIRGRLGRPSRRLRPHPRKEPRRPW